MSHPPDISVALLLRQLNQSQGRWLVVADENWQGLDWSTVHSTKANSRVVFSNRFDIAEAAQQARLDCTFNDFDFSHLAPQSFDGVVYRVSKERATNHHIINCAGTLLKSGGTLLLGGEKNDGLKTYAKQAGKLFDNPTHAEKNGRAYIASITLDQLQPIPLDDQDYPQLRAVHLDNQLTVHSKPGIFGWDKIDRGSALLAAHLPQFLDSYPKPPQSVLDLGCGYGYLALCASQYNFQQIVATDNNAAALTATRENLGPIDGIHSNVIATNAGDQLSQQFDTILCNPPFHRGFTTDNHLSAKFLQNTQRLLKPDGRALFVVNTFIPLEQKAKHFFETVEVVETDGSFKLVMLTKLGQHKFK